MITLYRFDESTGELYEKIEVEGPLTERTTYGTLRLGPLNYVEMSVAEGADAEREMFNHFGDDSSWPPGWWRRLTEGRITKKRMTWQRYFGVHDVSQRRHEENVRAIFGEDK